MLKFFLKFFLATSFVVALMFIAKPVYAGTLSCSITTAAACTGGTNTIILRMSGSSNAHAELPSQSNYTGNVICCSGVNGLGNSCSGTNATVLKLSGTTNAHVEQNTQSNYANNACISVPAGSSVSVGYQSTNCSGYDATLGSMSGTTNAHVGNSATYPSIQICATAAGPVIPSVTNYTNSTETALNSANCATTGCGARIGGGAGFRQSVTITGTNFGADPGTANRSTATNNIKIGAHQIANANVTAWSNTSITFLTDSAVTGDTDTDWGTVFGGTGALTVTAGSQTSAGVDFYLFPQITSITQPSGFPADSAREYDAGDTDGIITLNGTRFGSSAGSGSVTILSTSASTTSWANTAIAVQVPTAISDTVNTGSIVINQGTGSNGKTYTYNTLRVLPRITSIVPGNGTVGTSVTVNGNHFCQSGTCPGSFSAADKVTFTSGVVATTFTSWSATAIATAVPTGAVTGNVVVTSNTSYSSNAKSFTVDASTTTLATGTDPSATTIAPGASATDVDRFTLQTNGATEPISSITVNLSTNSGISLLAITDNANTVLGSTASPTVGSNVISVSGMSATTSLTTFKVRVTPLSHIAMPAPAGGAYVITAPVTAWAGGNAHTGSDTNPNALTIDNLSPGATTAANATPGDAQVQLSWTNPGDSDFGKVIIYCKTASITESPTEGTDPSVDGAACDSTARVKYSGSTSPQTFSGLTNGTTYYFRIYARDTNGNFTAYSSTQQVTGTPAGPDITTYTNTTETGLNYAGACVNCGARIGPSGAGFAQTVTITGTNLGTVAAGNRSTVTNNIKIGTHQIADANVTAWTPTSITFVTNTSTTGEADTDWGTNFGGATALKVTAGSTQTSGLNFYIFPQITSITQPSGFPADSAREYSSGDTDGVITLNGTRFGTAQGSGGVAILGSSSTTNSWGNTAIAAQVPVAIADNTYTGSIIVTQGTGSNGKTNTYNTLRILPRITSLDPSSEVIGEPIIVNGNHFCQAGSSNCPTVFSSSNKVTFTTAIDATVFTSWSNTAIGTKIPIGAVVGPVIVTSNSYTSNGSNFTPTSPMPGDPTGLGQFKDSGFTQSISVGDTTTLKPIYLKMTMQADISGGTLYPQVEYKPIGTSFVCTGTAVCASDALEGTGVAGPGPATGFKSISPTVDNVYHWQARIKHTRNGTDYYSAWVSFGGNAENATDFNLDTTPPVVTNVSSGTPGTNSVTITWMTSSEISTSQVQWNKTGTFVNDCVTNNDCTSITDTSPMVNSHSVTLSNLDSGTTYSYRVRSKDVAGNETIDVNNSFITQTIASPAKTLTSYIDGATGTISGATTYYFTVTVPETTPVIKNAYVEVLGEASGGTGTIAIKTNNVATRTYDVSASSPTMYRFLYPISSPDTETNLNLNDNSPCTNGNPSGTPPCNKVIITPATVNINILSAKIITTYSYAP
jgi:hypothetical protein